MPKVVRNSDIAGRVMTDNVGIAVAVGDWNNGIVGRGRGRSNGKFAPSIRSTNANGETDRPQRQTDIDPNYALSSNVIIEVFVQFAYLQDDKNRSTKNNIARDEKVGGKERKAKAVL